MGNYICNPLNISYKYQFIKSFSKISVTREGADPSLVLFKGKYYLFLSMNAGFYTSDDLADWEYHFLEGTVPIHDYAPDVCVIGDYMYFCASKLPGKNCPIYRSKDPINEPFTEVSCTFNFWDPKLFADDDGRVYMYWGCSNKTPIRVVELNPKDMTQKGEVKELFLNQLDRCGYERLGEDHEPAPSKSLFGRLMGVDKAPYIEGPWMTKYNGKYYLQYATPGTQYNVYADGVYISDSPMGPFKLVENNPFSYKPGGFCPGAGHGSTLKDKYGNWWHISTARISVDHIFERRIGIWPAGFDQDGELFCNQRFGDWVMRVPQERSDPWQEPEWMLLSAGKKAYASSHVRGKGPEKATEENIRTWWRAASNSPGEWLKIDLGEVMDVRAIQINFADDGLQVKPPRGVKMEGMPFMKRYIDTRPHYTRWILEASKDDRNYFIVADKSNAMTDLPHDLVVSEDGFYARYIKLTVIELPFNQPATVSGLRVFGKANKKPPIKAVNVQAKRLNDFDMEVSFKAPNAIGCNILWGHAPNKLYHCYTVYGENRKTIRALVKGQKYFVRVDTFNEGGITHGDIIEVKE